ncbi:MAG: ketopantoate reductase family protein [Candidatus Dormibacterales bacterium]
MRVAVVGAGATGGFIGARLERAGADVVLIARGAHLAAMRSRGLRVLEGRSGFSVHPDCTDDLGAIGQAGLVILTLKAHSLPPIARELAAALAPGAVVVSAQNGIPWWYFQRHGGPLEGTRLRSVDPEGALAENIDPARLLASVVYPATRLAEPGVVEHVEGTRLSVGELDGTRSERVEQVSGMLTGAGFKAPVQRRIRQELWLKLLGNAAFNPVSALTGATLAEIGDDPLALALVRAVMEEADAVARGLKVEIPIGIDRRIEAARAVGDHKTSMLQDLEAGRPLEVEALVGALIELGGLVGVPTPHLETLHATVALLDRTRTRRRLAGRG